MHTRAFDSYLECRFPVKKIEEIIKSILETRLSNHIYASDQCPTWTKDISDEVKNQIKDLKLNRYKIVVQTLIGEKRGQGIRFGTRSFWDNNTDFSATNSFLNESLYACVVAYGIWTY